MEIVVFDLKIFLYTIHTKSQHDYKASGPSEAVEERPVLCERLHKGLATVVDSEGRNLQQQQLSITEHCGMALFLHKLIS